MKPQDRLILITRNTEEEYNIAMKNASIKLDKDRWNKMKEVSSMGRSSLKYNDPKFIEISVNELLNSTPDRLLSVLPLVGFDIRDKELFSAVLQEQREKQPSYE